MDKFLHGVLHGMQWKVVHGLLSFALSLLGEPNTKRRDDDTSKYHKP